MQKCKQKDSKIIYLHTKTCINHKIAKIVVFFAMKNAENVLLIVTAINITPTGFAIDYFYRLTDSLHGKSRFMRKYLGKSYGFSYRNNKFNMKHTTQV